MTTACGKYPAAVGSSHSLAEAVFVAALALCDKKFPGKIHSVDIWKVSEELEDEYFKEKLVVNLGI